MILSFFLGFLTSYLWREHRNANKLNIENKKALEK